MRVEWVKSRARAQHHLEEINIVREEMNRTSRFFQWKENIWRLQGTAEREQAVSPEYAEGLRAYAERQAVICQDMCLSFERIWSGVDDMIRQAKAEIADPQAFYQRREREEVQRQRRKNKAVFSSPLTAGAGPSHLNTSTSLTTEAGPSNLTT
jgi:hypothetical protein